MSFLLYLVGTIVFIAGLGWLATMLGVSQTYIVIAALVLLGIGIFTAIARTRHPAA
jgi:small basic protein